MNLDRFHHIGKDGTPTGVYDYEIYKSISEEKDMFVVAGTPYFYKDGCYHADTYGTKLKSQIASLIYPKFLRSNVIERIYRLFLIDDSLQRTPEELNAYPQHWINFLNAFYDTKRQELVPHSPKYLAINQLAVEYHPQKHLDGQNMDAWLRFIAPDSEDLEMLLQYSGYCMTRSCAQQKFLILVGSGGSGKSTFLRLLTTVIGQDNISSVSLQELTQRFASYGLMGKTLNCCADIEVGKLENVALLKQILGEDLIRCEQKGKDAFSFRSYAKLIFSANELPLIISERTNGFYRRLMVLEMNNLPAVHKPDFLDTLLEEKDYFVQLCVEAVTRMYEAGTITTSANSERAVQRLRVDSDTVESWLCEKCILDVDAKTERGALFANYETYCNIQDRTALKRNSFYRSLISKGYQEKRTAEARYFVGITINHNPSSSLA